jgi:hypothetical protein
VRISVKFRKFGYSAATFGCAVAAGCVVVFGKYTLRATKDNPTQTPKLNTEIVSAAKTRFPSRDEVLKLCDRPLRRPLYDPPPPKPEVKQLPPLQVELVGTIVEDTNSVALVKTEKGNVEYKRIGDEVGPVEGPAKVIEIKLDEVVLERAAERITLNVNKAIR